MVILDDFKKFALRGNLIELAIGFTVGAAFSTVAESLVDDILMPPIGLLLDRVDFKDLFVLLSAGGESPPPYLTGADAQASGAVTLNYGMVVNNVIALVLVAVAMFVLIRVINRMESALEKKVDASERAPSEPETKKCPFCRTSIAYRATRCPHCTSTLEAEAAQT